MEILLFPVKPGAQLRKFSRGFGLGAVLLLWSGACGYRAVYSGEEPAERLSVVSGKHQVAELEAIEGVLGGVRAELSKNGALGSGTTLPRAVVEVLRVDELPSGIVAPDPPGGSRRPIARGMLLGVTARAWVEEGPSGSPVVDTGDVRRVAAAQSSETLKVDSAVRRSAIRAAAREVGESLARRLLGEAEPAVEPM